MLTAFGMVALSFMMLMYALERRDHRFVLAFALGCALSSTYGFLSGAWPFGAVEAVWMLVALRRWQATSPSETSRGSPTAKSARQQHVGSTTRTSAPREPPPTR
ncbi:MAG: hypothetical protein ACYCYA_11075 [Actinomycetes bacterium]